MGDLDSELLCAICHEELEDPRFLPCHHYFCAACIQSVADTAGALQNNSSFQKMAQILRRKSFPCPECRKNTVLPGNNARSLPQAFVVNRMKESLRKLRSKPAALNPATCTAQACKLHDIALKLLCLDCQQMICPECVLSTHKYHKYEYPDQVSIPSCIACIIYHICGLMFCLRISVFFGQRIPPSAAYFFFFKAFTFRSKKSSKARVLNGLHDITCSRMYPSFC